MKNVLVLCSSAEGQTVKIAKRIASVLEDRGHSATVQPLDPGCKVLEYDAIVVGASIHAGRYFPQVEEFIRVHCAALQERRTGFFSVCLSIAVDDEEAQRKAREYVDHLLSITRWRPDTVVIFGGALRYTQYGFLKRYLMRELARRNGHDTDMSRDYEYTKWEDVAMFARDFAVLLGAETGKHAR